MKKARVAVLISGRGSNLQSLLDAAGDAHFPAEIIQVISNQPEAAGLERARKAGVDVAVIAHKAYENRAAFDTALNEHLSSLAPDLVCLAGFMRILGDGIVSRWQGRMVNIHPSLLPSFKGLHTHQRAIDAGVKLAGCTIHYVVPEMDAGPIIAQAAVPVLPDDDAQTLGARVLAQEHILYPRVLPGLARGMIRLEGDRVWMDSSWLDKQKGAESLLSPF